MTRKIDAALLNEKLAALSREKGNIDYDADFSKEEIMKLIDSQPSTDAVMVIHCRECKEYDPETKICSWWNIHIHDKENYCIQGARKKND